MMGLVFQWDGNKAKTNLEKHDIEFEEAATIFGDPYEITINDPIHSKDEDRFVSIGYSYKGIAHFKSSATQQRKKIPLS